MCGIFGIIISPVKEITFDTAKLTVNHLFRLSESRGSDSSGLSVLAGDMIQVYKKAEKASVLIRNRDYNKFLLETLLGENSRRTNRLNLRAKAIIGHTRMATDGSENMHHNNQPIICDQTIGVHNGIVVNADSIWSKFSNFSRKYEVDSEIIFRLIQYYLDKQCTIYDSAIKTFQCIEGMTSIACMFGKRDFILLATNNGSLYILKDELKNVVIFASERLILHNLMKKSVIKKFIGTYKIEQLEHGKGCTIDINSLEIRKFSLMNPELSDRKIKSNTVHHIIRDLSPVKLQKADYVYKLDKSPRHLIDSIKKRHNHILPSKLPVVRCKRCILPKTMPYIKFDNEGICNYCKNYKQIKIYAIESLQGISARYRRNDGSYDCIVGISGGRDSVFGLHYVKTVLKMNPIAYTYDWGMVTDLARRNISRICGKLGVEHILISADIKEKRRYIKKNVIAWLKRPNIGMVPLFMAGDKAYFSHAQRLKKKLGVDVIFLCENMIERTDFKTGFANIKPYFDENFVYTQSLINKLKLLYFYGEQYVTNIAYVNSSIIDTLFAYLYYYFTDRDYYNIYKYIPWKEQEIIATLRNEYDWELAEDTVSTWRIGDGTASFYNYIYYTMAGFTENDTFRSNQIREGIITREEALMHVEKENQPRWDSIQWYCDTIGVDFEETIKIINSAPKLYEH